MINDNHIQVFQILAQATLAFSSFHLQECARLDRSRSRSRDCTSRPEFLPPPGSHSSPKGRVAAEKTLSLQKGKQARVNGSFTQMLTHLTPAKGQTSLG